jgi:two-component system chemotaxis response regulator CheB
LLIDDSPLARRLLVRALAAEGLELVGESAELETASELIERLQPDVVVLEVERAQGDGLHWLTRLARHHPVPFIVCSSLGTSTEAALHALAAGALAVVNKPTSATGQGQLARDLAAAVRRTELLPRLRSGRTPGSPPSAPAAPAAERDLRVIALGASTGGTAALERVLGELLPDGPPVLIVQHLPTAQITSAFAARLDRELRRRVEVARDGELLLPGEVWIAPADRHLALQRVAGKLRIELDPRDRVNSHRPAVDVLFRSLATHEQRSVGVLLTGAGSDGARGLQQLRRAGARTIIQDEASSVVWGMPRAALELDAADEILPLRSIAHRLNQLSREGLS